MDSGGLVLKASSGFLPSGTLLEPLIHISHEVASMEKLPFIQVRNALTMIRRIKLLSSLFEEIEETNLPLSPSSILCLTELFSVIRRVKVLIKGCKDGSALWGIIQTEVISNQFYVLVKEMRMALDILPLSLLNILTTDIREQVELFHKQAKRVDLFVDPKELQRRGELREVMASNNEKKRKNGSFIDAGKVKEIFGCIGLKSPLDHEEEIRKLEAEARKQAGTERLVAVSNINNLISIVSYSKNLILSGEQNEKTEGDINQRPSAAYDNRSTDHSSSSQSMLQNIPDEFCCPLSLDLIRDPVIVASGHTYDRNSIAQWINSGHYTCPKSGQKSIHMALVPNYALKSLVHQWCPVNNVPLIECSSSSASPLERSNSQRETRESAIEHISAARAAIDAVKITVEFLVGKLAMGSPEIQRQAAYELRLLAKTGMDHRRIIAEAGTIPFLVTLLSSSDPRIQENAVTALLNVSIFNNNKIPIMAAGAIDSIVEVLESGGTMEARENAAAAIFSLSMIDDHKVVIGAHPRAIPALVRLLQEGTAAGKRAATAMFNLARVTDDALTLMALLIGCPEGLEAVKKSRVLVPLLIDLLRFGSAKGKENSITLPLGRCKDGGQGVASRLLTHPQSIPSLQILAADGSLKARRKADALIRLLNRCCSHSQNPVV
ncbi:hypothetical protein SLA2020_504360 [Shorea laevis]